MKITRRQLRKLITETMITPSAEVIRQILDDPDVDERIKVILRAGDEESISQALSLLATIYPDKYGDIDIEIQAAAATTDYEGDFRSKTAQLTFEANPAEAIESFMNWLSEQVKNPSPAMMNHFKAAIAEFFTDVRAFGEYYHFDRSHSGSYTDDDFIDEIEADPLRALIVDEYLNLGIMPSGSLVDPDLWENLYFAIKDYAEIADVRDGLVLAHEELVREGEMYYVEDDVQVREDVFTDPIKWLRDNGYSELI